MLGCRVVGRLRMILFNILVVYLYGLEFLLLVLIYNVEFCKLLLNVVDNIDVLLIVLLFVCCFFCVEDGILFSDVVDRFRMFVVLEVVDILLIVCLCCDLIFLFGVCLFLLLFDFFKLSKCLCDRVFLCLCDGVCDWLDFFSVVFLGVFSRFKLLFDLVGDKEFRNKL